MLYTTHLFTEFYIVLVKIGKQTYNEIILRELKMLVFFQRKVLAQIWQQKILEI